MAKAGDICVLSLDTCLRFVYTKAITVTKEVCFMEHIKTLNTRDLAESAVKGGCGECQTSCQSACKTSCGIANQQCEKAGEKE